MFHNSFGENKVGEFDNMAQTSKESVMGSIQHHNHNGTEDH